LVVVLIGWEVERGVVSSFDWQREKEERGAEDDEDDLISDFGFTILFVISVLSL